MDAQSAVISPVCIYIWLLCPSLCTYTFGHNLCEHTKVIIPFGDGTLFVIPLAVDAYTVCYHLSVRTQCAICVYTWFDVISLSLFPHGLLLLLSLFVS